MGFRRLIVLTLIVLWRLRSLSLRALLSLWLQVEIDKFFGQNNARTPYILAIYTKFCWSLFLSRRKLHFPHNDTLKNECHIAIAEFWIATEQLESFFWYFLFRVHLFGQPNHLLQQRWRSQCCYKHTNLLQCYVFGYLWSAESYHDSIKLCDWLKFVGCNNGAQVFD